MYARVRSRSRPRRITPAGELQRRSGLYAETRPVLKLDPEKVPEHLRHLVPLAEKWGIGDDIIRNDFIDKAMPAEKRELHDAFYEPYERITAWLNAFEPTSMTDEAEAFMYAQGALDEMGYYILEEKVQGPEPAQPDGAAAPYYRLEPEVAGGWGSNTRANRDTHPPVITQFEYAFQGWLGSDLMTAFPEFIVTEPLAAALEESGLTGFHLADVEVSQGEMWKQFHAARPVPRCRWLKVSGTPGHDDLGLTKLARLVVSERALALLRTFSLVECEIHPWQD